MTCRTNLSIDEPLQPGSADANRLQDPNNCSQKKRVDLQKKTNNKQPAAHPSLVSVQPLPSSCGPAGLDRDTTNVCSSRLRVGAHEAAFCVACLCVSGRISSSVSVWVSRVSACLPVSPAIVQQVPPPHCARQARLHSRQARLLLML